MSRLAVLVGGVGTAIAAFMACRSLAAVFHQAALEALNVGCVFLVNILVVVMLISIFMPGFAGRLLKASSPLLGRLCKIIIVGSIDTLILASQLIYAVCTRRNVGDRVVDAVTHYVERITDLLLRPHR